MKVASTDKRREQQKLVTVEQPPKKKEIKPAARAKVRQWLSFKQKSQVLQLILRHC